MTQICSWWLQLRMLKKLAIFLVGLHWDIYWVLWTLLSSLCFFKFWYVIVGYSLGIVAMKRIAYNKRFVYLQIGSCTCQYLGALDPNRQWTHPLVTRWPSNIPYFWAYEVNRLVKSYYLMGWSFLSWALRLSFLKHQK